MAQEFDSIDATIADLEARIAAMTEAVAALRKAKDALGLVGNVGGSSVRRGTADIQIDQFVGKSIVEAAEQYLKLVGRPARATAEIIEGLNRGGLHKVSPDSVTTLFTRSHNTDGPIVRVQKGVWGIAEWYPKRPPKLGRTTKEVIGDGVAAGKSVEELVGDELEAADDREEAK